MFPLSSYVHSVSNLLPSPSTSAANRLPQFRPPPPSSHCCLDVVVTIVAIPSYIIGNLLVFCSMKVVNSHNGPVSNSISDVVALDPIIDGLIKSNGNDWNHKDVL
ncbi:transmembrane protein, putative [Medicago truncatula]|uniref:Transmembrane protein, putative n=1 Tax=Medicago truncatula TaxID=3880 RepID=G7IE96_MEDTR|nr:transmembrane protein, putative [Medicago truncatula]